MQYRYFTGFCHLIRKRNLIQYKKTESVPLQIGERDEHAQICRTDERIGGYDRRQILSGRGQAAFHPLPETIKNVKETLRRIPDKGIGYGILRYLTDRKKAGAIFSIKPDISFNYLGQIDREVQTQSSHTAG